MGVTSGLGARSVYMIYVAGHVQLGNAANTVTYMSADMKTAGIGIDKLPGCDC